MSYIIGIDVGTSSLKGILVTKQGNVVATRQQEYGLETPQPGFSEQHPAVWTDALVDVLKQLLTDVPEAAQKTEGISFSGQMHSLVLLNDEGEILRNAILWNDVRTTPQCEEITRTLGDELIDITKNKALEGFTLPKLLWVKENEPDIWQDVARFLLPKDYVGFFLTGNQQMEYSDAAGTLLLNTGEKEWSQKILQAFDIPEKICPPLVESSDCIGYIKTDLATDIGFDTPVAVYSGGADNACAALAAGITSSGLALASIGTSGVFLSYEDDPKGSYGGHLHYFNHADKDRYYSMGVTLAAGHSLSWFKQTFASTKSYDELLGNISSVPIGSDNLLFTPYIAGERTPYTDSHIRGSFVGMSVGHTLDHFARAVIEGITFSLKDSQELMKQYAGKTFDAIVSVGGGAKNQDWLQIQADVFNPKIVTLASEQGPALGAAMIAAVGANWFDNMADCSREFVAYDKEYLPDDNHVSAYDTCYRHYRKVYPATKDIFN